MATISQLLQAQTRTMGTSQAPNARVTRQAQPVALPNGNLVVAQNGQGRMKLFISDGRFSAEEADDLIVQVVDGRWFKLPSTVVAQVLTASQFTMPAAPEARFGALMQHLRTLFARKGIKSSAWTDITAARSERLASLDAQVDEIA